MKKKPVLSLYTDASIKDGVTHLAYVIQIENTTVSQQRISLKRYMTSHLAEVLAAEIGLYYVQQIFDVNNYRFRYYTDCEWILLRKVIRKKEVHRHLKPVKYLIHVLKALVKNKSHKLNKAHAVARGECWMLY